MRHGEAEDLRHSQNDHERALTVAGIAKSRKVAVRLAELQWQPDIMLVSDSQRTRQTMQVVADSGPFDCPYLLCPTFYLGGFSELKDELSGLPDNIQTALVIGHNPGWSEAAQMLSGRYCALAPADAILLNIDNDRWQGSIHHEGLWQMHADIR